MSTNLICQATRVAISEPAYQAGYAFAYAEDKGQAGKAVVSKIISSPAFEKATEVFYSALGTVQSISFELFMISITHSLTGRLSGVGRIMPEGVSHASGLFYWGTGIAINRLGEIMNPLWEVCTMPYTLYYQGAAYTAVKGFNILRSKKFIASSLGSSTAYLGLQKIYNENCKEFEEKVQKDNYGYKPIDPIEGLRAGYLKAKGVEIFGECPKLYPNGTRVNFIPR